MSLILDALNRAERERSISQPAPTIATVHCVDPPAWVAFPWRRVLSGALLVLGTALMLLVWRYADVGGGVVGSAQAPRASGLAPTPVDKVGEAPPFSVTRPAGGPASATATLTATERGATDNAQAGAGRRSGVVTGLAGSDNSLRAPAAAATAGDEELINRLYKATAPASTRGERDVVTSRQPDVASHSVPAAGAEQAVAEAAQVAGQVVADVPYITDLPMQLRRDIPSLNYSEHLPAAPGGARVRLNGRLLGEGQTVAAELELLTIEEHGIVLQFRDVPFRLPALNRWVNF